MNIIISDQSENLDVEGTRVRDLLEREGMENGKWGLGGGGGRFGRRNWLWKGGNSVGGVMSVLWLCIRYVFQALWYKISASYIFYTIVKHLSDISLNLK